MIEIYGKEKQEENGRGRKTLGSRDAHNDSLMKERNDRGKRKMSV